MLRATWSSLARLGIRQFAKKWTRSGLADVHVGLYAQTGGIHLAPENCPIFAHNDLSSWAISKSRLPDQVIEDAPGGGASPRVVGVRPGVIHPGA
jgi:hypothetical protein